MLSLFRKMAGPVRRAVRDRLRESPAESGAAPGGGDGYGLVARGGRRRRAGRAWDDAAALAAYFRRRRAARCWRPTASAVAQVMLAVPRHHLYATSVRESIRHEGPEGQGIETAGEWLPFDASEAVVRRIEAGDVYDAAGGAAAKWCCSRCYGPSSGRTRPRRRRRGWRWRASTPSRRPCSPHCRCPAPTAG